MIYVLSKEIVLREKFFSHVSLNVYWVFIHGDLFSNYNKHRNKGTVLPVGVGTNVSIYLFSR